jgi:protein FAM50
MSKTRDEVIMRLEKARNESKTKFEQAQSKIKEEANSVKQISSKFATTNEEILRNDTIGLVSLEDFTKRNENNQSKQRNEQKKRKRKKDTLNRNVLSFQEELEEHVELPLKKSKLEVNPDIQTAFLPDKEREETEMKEREALKEKWIEQQEEIKQQEIEITYSYWNGSGNRSQSKCKMGASIEHFLYMIQPEWKELKRISVSDLMFVKEDTIIPHNFSFYDLISSKARGISGPLFVFEVKDDVRALVDVSVETEESHAAKVVDRRWYEQNKTRWPYCRWQVYDPTKILNSADPNQQRTN